MSECKPGGLPLRPGSRGRGPCCQFTACGTPGPRVEPEATGTIDHAPCVEGEVTKASGGCVRALLGQCRRGRGRGRGRHVQCPIRSEASHPSRCAHFCQHLACQHLVSSQRVQSPESGQGRCLALRCLVLPCLASWAARAPSWSRGAHESDGTGRARLVLQVPVWECISPNSIAWPAVCDAGTWVCCILLPR